MSDNDTRELLVESLIDGIVEGNSVEDAMSVLLEDESDQQVESVELDLDENLDDVECPTCGETGMEPRVIEGEDGEEIPVVYCEGCDTGLLPASLFDEDDDDDAEIDLEHPVCPECDEEDSLVVFQAEGEDEEDVLACEACETEFEVTG